MTTATKPKTLFQKEKVDVVAIDKINRGVRPSTMRYNEREWEDFVNDIKEKGVTQPIALMKYSTPFDGYTHYLLAGWHRLQAVSQLEGSAIPARVFDEAELTDADRIAIRIRENMTRKGLTPAQEAAEIGEFHRTCLKLYGEKKSTKPDAVGHSQADTARLLGLSTAKISEALKGERIFKEIPELAEETRSWKDLNRIVKDAERELKREEKREAIAEVREQQADLSTTQLQEEIDSWYVIQDAVQGMKSLPGESVDLIEFDPDYPIFLDEGQTQNLKAVTDKIKGRYHEVSRENFKDFFTAVSREAFRLLKPEGWFIVWFGYEFFYEIQHWLASCRFCSKPELGQGAPLFRHAKWFKGEGFAHSQNPHDHLGHSIEPFFYLKKSPAARMQRPRADVFHYSPVHYSKRINPYQKPISLYEDIYRTFCGEDSYILSPCAGSGAALLAAANYNCIATGFDLSEDQKKDFHVEVFSAQPPAYGKGTGK